MCRSRYDRKGASLLQQEAVHALQEYLLPVATVITPNVPEAEVLTGMEIHNVEDSKEAAVLHKLGAKYVLMKGGHAEYQGNEVIDFSLMEKNLLSLEASEFFKANARKWVHICFSGYSRTCERILN